jgi:hypothetical protein
VRGLDARLRCLFRSNSLCRAAGQAAKGILSSKLGADELRASFAGLGDSEKEAYRIGAVSAVVSKMRGDPSKLGDMTKYLRSAEVRDKLAAIMPSKAASDAWKRRLDFEVSSSELVGQSLRNSATAKRLAEMQDAKGVIGDLVLHAFTGASSTSLAMRLIAGGRSLVRDTMRSRADREIAKMLTRPASRSALPFRRAGLGPRVLNGANQ